MFFLKKIIPYFRNKYYIRKTLRSIEKLAPEKVVNTEEFLKYFKFRDDQQYAQKDFLIYFKDGFRISCKGLDLPALAETCILEDYKATPNFEIQKGQVILDVGAHIGTFSVYAASKGAKVYAIEPDENNFTSLQKNIEINNFQSVIMPIKGALFYKKGKINLNFSDTNSGGHTVTNSGNNSPTTLVECFTIFDLAQKFNLNKIDLIKMDIEGAEYEIVEWSKPENFEIVKAIVGEYHLNLNNNKNFAYLKKYLKPYFKTVKRYAPYYFYALK